MASFPTGDPQSLLILVGITATKRSRSTIKHFFELHSSYRTFVPRLPLRRGVRASARWLEGYLAQTVRTQETGPIHVLAYIGGGVVLRYLTAEGRAPELRRVLYVRGPVQELVPAGMVRKYGRLVGRLLGGRTMIDLADGWPDALPFPVALGEQGLIVENGVSSLAHALGLDARSLSAASWDPARLLPGASAVLRVAESHDEVYSSPALLEAALHFFDEGRFGAGRVSAQVRSGAVSLAGSHAVPNEHAR